MTFRNTALLYVAGGVIAVMGVIAQQSETEAPAGFTTPTLGLAIGPGGELIGKPGVESVSNGIKEPPGDTFALDQAQFERRHDPSTGLGPLFNATSCAECHQNGVTGAASQFTELRVGHKDANGNFVNPTILIKGGADAVRELAAAQYSKHLILLRWVREAARPDDWFAVRGYELLAEVQWHDPAVAEFVIGRSDQSILENMRAVLSVGHGPFPFGKARGERQAGSQPLDPAAEHILDQGAG